MSGEAEYNLATALVAAGALDEAAAHFRRAIELDPADGVARNSLGALLYRMGQGAEAVRELREAVRAAPLYASAHHNLGVALAETGAVDEAVTALLEAVRIAPGRPDTRVSLGNVLHAAGHVGRAIDAYRHALAVRPDWVPALTRLAWILATAGDAVRQPAEAVALAEDALSRVGRDDPAILDALAAAYAADGRFDLAIATAERAMTQLSAAPRGALARAMAGRLALYRAGVAYRERDAR
jgi:tetratricopeptide (TPR) repeat protein